MNRKAACQYLAQLWKIEVSPVRASVSCMTLNVYAPGASVQNERSLRDIPAKRFQGCNPNCLKTTPFFSKAQIDVSCRGDLVF